MESSLGMREIVFAGLGLYLQVWLRICSPGVVFAGLVLDLKVWACTCMPGLVFASLGLYLQL